ncbi:MAG: hypothetical protein PHI35_01055 [Victivallaceae bacterium]|nr:hypothetical protein [Victivallaceae bacterium]
MKKKFFYHGASMRREFRPDDVIEGVEIGFDQVRPGDVIIFHLTGDAEATIHRALRRTGNGWITRGDNNPAPDARPVPPESPLYLAVAIERGTRVLPVRRGWAGRLTGAQHRLRRFIRLAAAHFLAKPLILCWPKRDAAKLEVTRFGKDILLTEPGGRPVRARVRADGKLRMADFMARLHYRQSDLEKRAGVVFSKKT